MPEFDRSVVAATGKQASGGVKACPSYPVAVTAQDSETTTSTDLPQADGLIFAPTCEQASIGAKGDRAHPAAVVL